MNKILNIIIVSTLLFTSCKHNDLQLEEMEMDVINTVEELDAIIENCRNNEFESREEIEGNLIGEWKLIGIRSGWVNEFTKRDITLNIDQNSIVLNDLTTEEVSETDWELKFYEVNTYEYYYLETNEEGFNNRLGMESFCQKYMYGSGRVDDGSTYVYAKVQ